VAEGLESQIESESSATVYLDPRIYSKEVILRAAYWYTGVAFIQVPESPDGRLTIRVKLKQSAPTLENPNPVSVDRFVDEFCNALLDFELRRQVEAETAPVRQLILAKALSESGVLEDQPPGEITDPVESATPSSLVQIMTTFPSVER
jgi:His-Xaa-Ser system protein HxsD